MGHFSGDPVLLDIYRTGKDIYRVTGEHILGRELEGDERGIFKTLILALGYGAGPPKVAQILFVNGYPTSTDRAKEYMSHLESLYSVFFGWKRFIDAEGRRNGYVKTIGGRFRRLRWSYGDASWKVRNKAARQAVNSIVQGSAADILRRNMLACRQYEPGIGLLNQVHDELVWEYYIRKPHTLANLCIDIQLTCESPGYDLDVPLRFEPNICNSWADKGSSSIELLDEEDEYESV
jgi:DNA polymerase-1